MMRPAIIVGGDATALSVARNLSRAGIPVYLLNRPNVSARYSRWGRWITVPGGADTQQDWRRFVLGSDSDRLAGAVLLACSDEAIARMIDSAAITPIWTWMVRRSSSLLNATRVASL